MTPAEAAEGLVESLENGLTKRKTDLEENGEGNEEKTEICPETMRK